MLVARAARHDKTAPIRQRGVTGHRATSRAAAWRTGEVAISGFGDGHGVGMGQWGAFGYASEYGWSYKQILAHYYGGTTLGRLPSPEPDIKVHLAELNGRSTVAAGLAGGGLVASWPGGVPATARAFEVTRRDGTEIVHASSGCAGPWREVARTAGPVTLASRAPGTGQAPAVGRAPATGQAPAAEGVAGSEVQACLAGTGPRTYPGVLVVSADGQTDNVVGLEAYLRGVLPAESPASWAYEGGEAALEAQAVAARSYAVAMVASSGQICDTAACQVYRGLPGRYASPTDAAVDATAGQVLYCDAGSSCGPAGSVALAEYSASTGGYTAGGLFPAVADRGDLVPANPVHSWNTEVPLPMLARRFPSLGQIFSVQVDRRNGLGQFGGRVLEVTITGTKRSINLSGAGFAVDLSLPSNWFRIVSAPAASPPPGSQTTTTTTSPTTTSPPVTAAATTSTAPAATSTAPAATTTARWKDTSTVPSATTGTTMPTASSNVPAGYWVATSAGAVRAFGAARFYGNALRTTIAGQVSAIAATPDGRGYWLVGRNGVVLAFGDATWYGSANSLHLAAPVVAMAATPDGRGYWLLARDGGVFAYGDARYYGSPSGHLGHEPAVSLAPTPDGHGYWLVSRSGQVFVFGDARYHGSAAGAGPVPPIVAITLSRDGQGYWLVSAAGGVHGFGDAAFAGSLPTRHIHAGVVGAAASGSGEGYYLLASNGATFGFGLDPSPSGGSGTLAGSLGSVGSLGAGRPVAVAAYR